MDDVRSLADTRQKASRRMNLLVRMPNWLGDCVMATPALRHLAETFPEARVFLAGRAAFRNLFLAQPGVAGFVEAPGSGFGRLLRGLVRAGGASSLFGLDCFDVGLLLTNSFSTAAWMWRAGARLRVGYNTDARRLFLTDPVPCGDMEKSWHFIHYYMWLAKVVEVVTSEATDISHCGTRPLGEYRPALDVGPAGWDEARMILEQAGIDGGYAVFAPASAYGPVKDWPAERYSELAAMMNADLGLPVLLTGGTGQAAACAGIAGDSRSVVNLAGKTTLDGFVGLLAGASLFVGGDSGGAHAAAAMGIPTVVVFGITNPSRTRPVGLKVAMVGNGEAEDVRLDTSGAREEAKRALEAIAVETVAAAAAGIMGKG